jgi:predicted aspartyl protease
MFDTGANLSMVTVSEAAALGLALRETNAVVHGSTGARNPLRLAIAPELRVGPARLTNVVLLVLADDALDVGPTKYEIRGILGMPVLHALGAFAITADGELRVGAVSDRVGGANISYDGWSPIVEVTHEGHTLRMLLDTGANVTTLFPTARAALAPAEIAALGRKREQSGGAGALISRDVDVVSRLRLEIAGMPIDVQQISLLREPTAGDDGTRDGVIGMDALRGGFTADFRAMRVRVAPLSAP